MESRLAKQGILAAPETIIARKKKTKVRKWKQELLGGKRINI